MARSPVEQILALDDADAVASWSMHGVSSWERAMAAAAVASVVCAPRYARNALML
jgi:hypothetical protein